MPYLTVKTNQVIAPEQHAALLADLSGAVSALLNKSEQYVMVCLEEGQSLMFAGSDDPAAYLEWKSIGLPADSTAELSSAMCEKIGSLLDVPASRVYIEFSDAPRNMWGWNGRTF